MDSFVQMMDELSNLTILLWDAAWFRGCLTLIFTLVTSRVVSNWAVNFPAKQKVMAAVDAKLIFPYIVNEHKYDEAIESYKTFRQERPSETLKFMGVLMAIVLSITAAVFDDFNVLMISWTLCHLAFVASYIDLKTHTIPDTLVFILVITMLHSIDVNSIRAGQSLVKGVADGAIVYCLLMLYNEYQFTQTREYGLGGGDIKFVCAVAIGLGVMSSLAILLAAIFLNFVKVRHIEKTSKPQALAPYLCGGFILAWYIIQMENLA
nr:A24 family peptidase [Enterovibrio norvegicus]PMH64531.1 hypothetical protein BCU62_15870 [Enterovibrio norvegicus]